MPGVRQLRRAHFAHAGAGESRHRSRTARARLGHRLLEPAARVRQVLRLSRRAWPRAARRARRQARQLAADDRGHRRRRRRALDRRGPFPARGAAQHRHHLPAARQSHLRADQGPDLADDSERQADQDRAAWRQRDADEPGPSRDRLRRDVCRAQQLDQAARDATAHRRGDPPPRLLARADHEPLRDLREGPRLRGVRADDAADPGGPRCGGRASGARPGRRSDDDLHGRLLSRTAPGVRGIAAGARRGARARARRERAANRHPTADRTIQLEPAGATRVADGHDPGTHAQARAHPHGAADDDAAGAGGAL